MIVTRPEKLLAKLKLVLPKGSLEAQTLRLFEEADLRVRRGSDRDYHGTIDDDRVERVSILRPQEIPPYVADGLFDLDPKASRFHEISKIEWCGLVIKLDNQRFQFKAVSHSG